MAENMCFIARGLLSEKFHNKVTRFVWEVKTFLS